MRLILKTIASISVILLLGFDSFDFYKPKVDELDAIIHLDYGAYEINDFTSSAFRTKFKATILNEKAKDLAIVVNGYDRLSRVSIVSAKVFGDSGELIYDLKQKDIIDRSSISNISVFEDNRLKALDLTQNQFPYTVEYEVLKEYDHTFFIPSWSVYPNKNIKIEESVFQLKSPLNMKPRFKQYNVPDSVYSEYEDAVHFIYNWSFIDYPPLKNMYRGQKAIEKLPVIYTSPSKFEYDGYRGDFSSWDDLAAWIHSLNQDRNDISVELKNRMINLTAKAKTDSEKIELVYDYLQNNTRYVSIQLGIGGFQPFYVSKVDEDGYGDCKALSYFTKSLLGAVGIDSKYTLVSAGPNPRPIDLDFPQSNFNHAILCVPNKGDTVWLECTSQTNPFGYMGTFTGDRDVLLIDEGKAKIVHTPIYNEDSNKTISAVKIEILENGDAIATERTSYQGLKFEYRGLNFLLNSSSTDQKNWMLSNSKFKNFDLGTFSLSLIRERPFPVVQLNVSYNLNKFARASGKRLFFGLNPFNSQHALVKEPDESSKNLFFEIEKGETEEFEFQFNFPENLRFEYVPDELSFESDFGSYKTEIIRKEGALVFKRKLKLVKGKFPKSSYAEYEKFIKRVNKNDNPKLVLNKIT